MKKTYIQLPEATYEALRQRASEEKRSLARMIRTILQSRVMPPFKKMRSPTLFSFIASGRSRGPRSGLISERHDEELAHTS